MYLFPKVNRTQMFPKQNYHVCCVGGMKDRRWVNLRCMGGRCDHEDCEAARKIISTREDFDPERMKKTDISATRCYAAQGVSLEPISSGLKIEKTLICMRFAKVEKREETKMIQCLEVAPYQSRENTTKKKRFTENSLPLCVHLTHLRLSLTLPTRTFRVTKGKKRNRLYFCTSTLLFLSAIKCKCRIRITVKMDGRESLWRSGLFAGLRNCDKRIRTSLALWRSFSDK